MPGADDIQYSDRYNDGKFEYRHVILPPDLSRLVPRTHLLSETEWRNLGVQQSPGWVHYLFHAPEPHVLLFRRPLPIEEAAETNTAANLCSQSQQSQPSLVSEVSQSSTASTNAVVCG